LPNDAVEVLFDRRFVQCIELSHLRASARVGDFAADAFE
jgi:hypothetical protein